MAVVSTEVALVKKIGADTHLLLPYTTVGNVEGGVASVNGVTPNQNGNVSVTIPPAVKLRRWS